MPKYITFTEVADTGKTKVFRIETNDRNRYNLGIIKWFPAFRKYSFFPANSSIFEQDCLKDIIDFMADLTEKRRLAKSSE
jgi:hypothetical protein